MKVCLMVTGEVRTFKYLQQHFLLLLRELDAEIQFYYWEDEEFENIVLLDEFLAQEGVTGKSIKISKNEALIRNVLELSDSDLVTPMHHMLYPIVSGLSENVQEYNLYVRLRYDLFFEPRELKKSIIKRLNREAIAAPVHEWAPLQAHFDGLYILPKSICTNFSQSLKLASKYASRLEVTQPYFPEILIEKAINESDIFLEKIHLRCSLLRNTGQLMVHSGVKVRWLKKVKMLLQLYTMAEAEYSYRERYITDSYKQNTSFALKFFVKLLLPIKRYKTR